ncbi:lasso peptide biosynthesis protein, partial [Streptomyces phaeochromogenes]|uniref:lasso peptide biosynthesis protein n=1 Tax=Streptomyces phaeochromogenes TaxID=1923 RepID=UPI0036C35BF3
MYEPPARVEVGAFAELTRGEALGAFYEGGFPPYEFTGVRTAPFRAHAWVEVDGLPVGEPHRPEVPAHDGGAGRPALGLRGRAGSHRRSSARPLRGAGLRRRLAGPRRQAPGGRAL